MSEIFNNKGCLTEYAFSQLETNQNLDELTRLEIAEHLAYCDSCLLQYTNYLAQTDTQQLLQPSKDLTKTVLSKIKTTAYKIMFNRYVTVVAAASFALVFTFSGVFENISKIDLYQQKPQISYQQYLEQQDKKQQIMQKSSQFIEDILNFNFLNKGDKDNEEE